MQYDYSQRTGHLFGIELGASKTKILPNTIKISLLYLPLKSDHGTKWLRLMRQEWAWIFPAISHSATAKVFYGCMWSKNWEETQKLCRMHWKKRKRKGCGLKRKKSLKDFRTAGKHSEKYNGFL